eukprot:CAMPEP_0169118892 /NCGR_PEP_ID=MMETSP1015-20121227/31245_1 /TAXON_ID=342587 /ORGANISM="Karlodinium micrum, Strain CCMP2283" /LENGTH=57 /DNA_ID=CAMNT_0009181695 /DNA_START=467 /DNA_END=640 /DNA_ORIENTATION=-
MATSPNLHFLGLGGNAGGGAAVVVGCGGAGVPKDGSIAHATGGFGVLPVTTVSGQSQ